MQGTKCDDISFPSSTDADKAELAQARCQQIDAGLLQVPVLGVLFQQGRRLRDQGARHAPSEGRLRSVALHYEKSVPVGELDPQWIMVGYAVLHVFSRHSNFPVEVRNEIDPST